MCHISRNKSELEVTVKQTISGGFPMVSPNSRVLLEQESQQSKMTFRISPFRKVAKSARINLNKYWGILSQSAHVKTTSFSSPKSKSSRSSSETVDYTEEMEQNRINEMLEAQTEAAMMENDRNSEYENSPDFHQTRRITYHSALRRPMSLSSTASSYSPLASSSSLFIPCPSDECLDVISQDSVFL